VEKKLKANSSGSFKDLGVGTGLGLEKCKLERIRISGDNIRSNKSS
jgi:hypothetical protein